MSKTQNDKYKDSKQRLENIRRKKAGLEKINHEEVKKMRVRRRQNEKKKKELKDDYVA